MAASAIVFRRLGERLQRVNVAGSLPLTAPTATRAAPYALRSLHVGARRDADKSYKFVVCGGGPGGLAVASSLGRRFGNGSLAVIEPADVRRNSYVTGP